MSDKVFLDTNILIYCYSSSDIIKQSKAQGVANLPNVFISTQVMKEFTNVLYKKFKLDWQAIRNALDELGGNFNVHTNTSSSIKRACQIADRYGFSFFDSLIIVAALEADCVTLYSEDMHDGQLIENKLTIKNPLV